MTSNANGGAVVTRPPQQLIRPGPLKKAEHMPTIVSFTQARKSTHDTLQVTMKRVIVSLAVWRLLPATTTTWLIRLLNLVSA